MLPSLMSHLPLPAEVLASRVIASFWAAMLRAELRSPNLALFKGKGLFQKKWESWLDAPLRSLRPAFLQFGAQRSTDTANEGDVCTALLLYWEQCPEVREARQLREGCLMAGLGQEGCLMAGLGQQARLHSCPDAISLLSDLTVPGEIIMQTKRSFSPWIWDAQHSTSLWKEQATRPLQ